MEDMIRKIVEADSQAKEMEKDLVKEKKELSRTIEKETQKVYDKYMNEALEVIERNDIAEEKKTDALLKDIVNKQKSAQMKLQSDYASNCDKWVDEIVKRVIK